MRVRRVKAISLNYLVICLFVTATACATTKQTATVNAAHQAKSILRTDLRNLQAMKTLIKEALREKRPHEAIGLCENALAVAPQDADLYSLQALAQYQLNLPLFAKALWQKALNLDPLHIPSLMNFGVLLFENGHSQKAGAQFDKILAIHPKHIHAQIGRALVMSAQGQPERAIAALEEVLNDNGENASVLENLALISRDRLKNYKMTIRYAERILALKHSDRRTLENAVSLKQESQRMISTPSKTLSDESLREMASAANSQNAQTSQRAEQSATQVQPSLSNDLMTMEDVLK